MKKHGLDCDLRESQRNPLIAGNYRRRLKELSLKNLYAYLNYLKIFSIPFISYVASYVLWCRMVEVPFYQRYLENVIFSISYFMLDPNFTGVFQIIIGEYSFWYIASRVMSKEWKLFALMFVFILYGTGYRWYGLISAFIHLVYTFSLSNIEVVSCTWCLGVQLAMLIGVSVLQVLPVGVEDVCSVYIVYYCVTYAQTKVMDDTTAKMVLAVAHIWMFIKKVRMERKKTPAKPIPGA